MNTGQRLASLSGLGVASAAAHLKAAAHATGTASTLMVQRSGLTGVSAMTHLLASGTTQFVNDWLTHAKRRGRR
jgi:hypothetical protein